MKFNTLTQTIVILAAMVSLNLWLTISPDQAGAEALNLSNGVTSRVSIGTTFSYQGRLNDNGTPANGVYDLRFTLYDALSGGSQVGSILTKDDVTITDGYFTIELDFGTDAFTGEARYLEVGVRPGDDTGGYTLLSPLQALTPAPYAVHADTAPGIVSVGSVVMHMASTVPEDWLECDGSSLLRADYPELFATIGTTYGSADADHFNLPDMRGYFVRGWDHGAGNDPDANSRVGGDTVGSTQDDIVGQHNHNFEHVMDLDLNGSGLAVFLNGTDDRSAGAIDTDFGEDGVGNETRPINIAVMYIIRAK